MSLPCPCFFPTSQCCRYSALSPRFSRLYPAIAGWPLPTFRRPFISFCSLSISLFYYLPSRILHLHFTFIILCTMTSLTQHPTTASKLRTLLAQKNEIVVCPGVYDGFTTRLALNAGFKILYMVSVYDLS